RISRSARTCRTDTRSTTTRITGTVSLTRTGGSPASRTAAAGSSWSGRRITAAAITGTTGTAGTTAISRSAGRAATVVTTAGSFAGTTAISPTAGTIAGGGAGMAGGGGNDSKYSRSSRPQGRLFFLFPHRATSVGSPV